MEALWKDTRTTYHWPNSVRIALNKAKESLTYIIDEIVNSPVTVGRARDSLDKIEETLKLSDEELLSVDTVNKLSFCMAI